MTIVYKSGRLHSDADCLSRAPVEAADTNYEDDDVFVGAVDIIAMSEKQRQDPELRLLIDYLEGHTSVVPKDFARSLPSFSLRSSVLYKRNFASSGKEYLLVMPTSLRDEVLLACHDEPTAGHLGYARTLARVKQKYYWPKLSAAVKQYVRTCRDCQRRKSPPGRPPGLLQPLQIPAAPFEQVGMDLLGPFPTSSSGNRWIIVATDYLTRYAETRALPRGTAVEVAHFFLENIVLRHGAPAIVITDRGTAFMAQLVRTLMTLSGTSHRRTTAYHPQTNGLTERMNKTIADMLCMYVDVEHKTWDAILPYVTFAYNTAPQETTRMTPFRVLYGRDVATMLDAMLPHVENDDDCCAQQITQRAEEARQLARVRIRDQQHRDASHYNLRRRHTEFQQGDEVWVWTPVRRRGLSEKLLRRYFGPYKVLRRLSDVTYEVVPSSHVFPARRQPRPETVHVVRMKPYYTR